MAGVAIRLPSARGELAAWAERLKVAERELRPRASEIIREELEDAVVRIQRISPVKTGLFRRSWKVQRRDLLTFAVVDTAPYAEWVHRRGEKGTLFWEAYALPEITAASKRAGIRIQDMLRAAVRSTPVGVFAGARASRSLRAMGRVRL